jgi:hypothetical protein
MVANAELAKSYAHHERRSSFVLSARAALTGGEGSRT